MKSASDLFRPEAIRRLETSRHVLIAGAGGGFDVFAGLPLYLALRALGKKVDLANLSFTYLPGTDAERLGKCLWRVTHTNSGEAYFPEKHLSEWLHRRSMPSAIYCFEKVDVRPLIDAYSSVVTDLGVDTIVLVDGGTDILMRGDEAGLGTPAEDMVSLAAVRSLDVETKLVTCIGFGIDAFHGVCHAHFLENVAALEQPRINPRCLQEQDVAPSLVSPRMRRRGGFSRRGLLRAFLDTARLLTLLAMARSRLPAALSLARASLSLGLLLGAGCGADPSLVTASPAPSATGTGDTASASVAVAV